MNRLKSNGPRDDSSSRLYRSPYFTMAALQHERVDLNHDLRFWRPTFLPIELRPLARL